MNFSYKFLIKIMYLILIFTCTMFITVKAQTPGKLRFNFIKGETFQYKIDIKFSQDNIYESTDEILNENGKVDFNGAIELFETIEVIENSDDYAKIVCRFDSLTANLASHADDSSANIRIDAGKDNIRIFQDDSLVSDFTIGSASDRAGSDFYDKLLFIGEDITMLVYPEGEIMNITENKNLWKMAREMIGMADDGFLEIIFPQNMAQSGRTSWDQAISIDKLGDFRLKDKPGPIVMHYTADNSVNSQIDFNGSLQLKTFDTGVSVADLSDEITLEIRNFNISKGGTAFFFGHRGILQSMKYKTEEHGEISLQGTGLESYETALSVRFSSEVSYTLLEKQIK